MGLFGITEVIAPINDSASGPKGRITLRSMLPRRDEVRRSVLPILRGTGIGAFFGTLPGTGQTIAAFISYAVEKRVAADPSRFGKGAIEGIAAPEAANNASARSEEQTSELQSLMRT